MKGRARTPGTWQERAGNLVIAALVLIPFVVVPVAGAAPDLMGLQNLTKFSMTGQSSGNATAAMHQYMDFLNATAGPMMSFFSQMMSLFGAQNQSSSLSSPGDLQKMLGQVMPANGSTLSP